MARAYRGTTTTKVNPEVERLRQEIARDLRALYAVLNEIEAAKSTAATPLASTATELDANGTTLTVDTIANGALLIRSGTSVTGATTTSAGLALLAAADAAAQRAAIGLNTAQGTVDFGARSDYAETVISAPWASTGQRVMVGVRGGTADHALGDEDALLEELHAAVVAVSAGVSVTVGVHAPNTTTGQYVVDILGAA